MKAVTNIFGNKNTAIAANGGGVTTPTKGSQSMDEWQVNALSEDEEALLNRPDVIDFINSMNASISDKLQHNEPSPRKVRLSIAGGLYSPSPIKHHHGGRALLFNSKRPTVAPNVDGGIKIQPLREDALLPAHTPAKGRANSVVDAAGAAAEDEGMDNILSGLGITNSDLSHDPEETERLVSRMLDVSFTVKSALILILMIVSDGLEGA